MEESLNISKVLIDISIKSVYLIPFIILLAASITGYLKTKKNYYVIALIGISISILVNLFSIIFFNFIQTNYFKSFVTFISFLSLIGNLVFSIGILLSILFNNGNKK